jgi:hypothetical protein
LKRKPSADVSTKGSILRSGIGRCRNDHSRHGAMRLQAIRLDAQSFAIFGQF